MPGDVCDGCGTKMPTLRKPANWRQALWGGWSCPNCGTEFDRWGRNLGVTSSRRKTWTLDNVSYATDPGQLTLSDAKLRVLRPDLYDLGQHCASWSGSSFRSGLIFASSFKMAIAGPRLCFRPTPCWSPPIPKSWIAWRFSNSPPNWLRSIICRLARSC